MELNVIWFILLTVLFSGFFLLEGFDYGVGILLPFLGKNDVERRMIINSIGPVWEGNEVWMITAGGAMFAAFPHVYATLFSGFYLALLIMLLALIFRGVSVEFRSKEELSIWRKTGDRLICIGSLLPALLWGVAVTNLIKGVPINASMQYAGTFFDLLSPYTLLGGVVFVLVFIFHGALYLGLKTEKELAGRARKAALRAGAVAAAACLGLIGLTYTNTDLFRTPGAGVTLWMAAVVFLLSHLFTVRSRIGWAFAASSVSILLLTVAFFWGLFPRLIVSSLNPVWSLTIYNASSSQYTLKLMTIGAAVFVPVILIYQGWSYWVFRKRVDSKHLEY